MVKFKQKCFKCRKNYVTVSRNQRFVICYDCQKEDLKGDIKDPKMKKMFDIPEEFYKENAFLRDIKVKYLQWGELTEKQIAAFEKTVRKMKGEPEPEKEKPEEKSKTELETGKNTDTKVKISSKKTSEISSKR